MLLLPPNTAVSEYRRFFTSPKTGGIGKDNCIRFFIGASSCGFSPVWDYSINIWSVWVAVYHLCALFKTRPLQGYATRASEEWDTKSARGVGQSSPHWLQTGDTKHIITRFLLIIITLMNVIIGYLSLLNCQIEPCNRQILLLVA